MISENHPGSRLPRSVMRRVYWSFRERGIYTLREDFDRDVRQYHVDVLKRDTWRPEQAVIPQPRVAVRYECWVKVNDDSKEEERLIEVAAVNGESISAGELLFSLHNAIADCELGDHVFFEGFDLDERTRRDPVPVYRVALGS